MPEFGPRHPQEPDEPNSSPRGPSMAGRVGNRLIAILRLAPTASYALAHVIVLGSWAYLLSDEGVAVVGSWAHILSVGEDDYGVVSYDKGLRGAFQATAIMIGFTAIPTVLLGILLGAFDAAARRSSRPLLLVVDALLIVPFALVWILPVGMLLNRESCDVYTCTAIPLTWPIHIGGLIGAELGLVVLLGVSVIDRLTGER